MFKLCVVVPLLFAGGLVGQETDRCAALASLTLPHTSIEAESISSRTAPAAFPEGATGLPDFCRVKAVLTPSADSTIHVEVWLPETWNGLFRGQGNGGFAGSIDYGAMARAAAQGYATAATDAGHSGAATDASWAMGHPEKIADFGYRAVHEMTVAAGRIVEAFYGRPAEHRFFSACSDGGREALMEAERFPADYDGIVAGAPAWNWTALVTNSLANSEAMMASAGSYIPAGKLPAISAAVLAACDGRDGLKDGIVGDPRACKVPAKGLVCRRGDSASCLTKAQWKTLQTLYEGSRDSSGAMIFPGFLPGAELGPGGWTGWISGEKPGGAAMFLFADGYFRNMVYGDAALNARALPIPVAYAKAKEKTAADLDATDANLTPFFDRGGKLVLYHGWDDPAISALSTLDYVGRVTAATSAERVAASTRLYMVPGMQHCAGGPGATFFGQLGWFPNEGADDPRHDVGLALEQWVAGGDAPGAILARHYEGAPSPSAVTFERPLCPYPEAAVYDGSGDAKLASSFRCSVAR